MVQLHLLSGSRAGTLFCGSRFPIRAGRAAEADLSLNEPGVMQRHFQIDWLAEGLVLQCEPEALLILNDSPVQRAVLRNGDILTLGALKIRFNFTPVRQYALATREWLTWIALAALCLGQVALVYLLIR